MKCHCPYEIPDERMLSDKMLKDFPFLIESPINLSQPVAYPGMREFHNMLEREDPISIGLIPYRERLNKQLQQGAAGTTPLNLALGARVFDLAFYVRRN